MNSVVRVFINRTYDPTSCAQIMVLSKQDLLDENIDYEDFANTVWNECMSNGYYDDSDYSSGVICIYFRGD